MPHKFKSNYFLPKKSDIYGTTLNAAKVENIGILVTRGQQVTTLSKNKVQLETGQYHCHLSCPVSYLF